ncbi:MAG: hypothetical protein MUC61_02675 [Amoebophilaceae bacterium]|jgi:hypothetical protein|nr:hypothetical protein [Amoebophilaceae bacterium]
MHTLLQIITKLYPDIFEQEHGGALAQIGKAVANNIKDDKNYVTREEAEAFYEALLQVANCQLEGSRIKKCG